MKSGLDAIKTPASSVVAEARHRVLQKRAHILAKEVDATTESNNYLEYLEFHVAFEKYGVVTRWIQEACILKDYTRLPGAPAFILGIMNLRGRILSIIDLKELFGLPRKGLTYHNKVIVIQNGEMTFGLLGDEITGVKKTVAHHLQPPLPTMTGTRADYTMGITPDSTVLLNVERMLTDPHLIIQMQPEQIST